VASKLPDRLKILHWPTDYPDPEYGLPYHLIFIQEHVRSASLYHDNAVMHISQPEQMKTLKHVSRTIENTVSVTRIRLRRLKNHEANRLQVYFQVARELLRLFLSGFWPDVIHIHIFTTAKMPLALARMLRIPVVVTEHWTALCREGVLSKARLDFAKHVYERANIVLPVCEYLRNCMRRTGADFRSRIILNAVDTSVFYWKPTRVKEARQKRILMVARLEEAKDVPTLLLATAKLKRDGRFVFLDLVGKGDDRSLVELAARLGISEIVKFHGGQPKPKIADLMRSADVFALPSLWENSPCVIGEALCCGLPVVATAVGGVPELLPITAGKLVGPSDPDGLARAIADVLDNAESYDQTIIAAEAQCRFSYEAIGKQIDEAYREVVEAAKPNTLNERLA
jgi:glycosyltransferase involved in cell wall biosynthesis